MAKDWLNQYGGTRKFQDGGAMSPAPQPGEGAPAGGPEQGGEANIEAMLSEYAQTRDPQLAVAICDMLVEAMMGAQQGAAPGGQPAPGGPEQGGAPMGKNGMKMSFGKKKGPVFKKKAMGSKC